MTVKLEIEKGVPCPPRTGGPKPGVALWRTMEIGDSVFSKSRGSLTRWIGAARKDGKTLVTRAVEGGYRIWRTA